MLFTELMNENLRAMIYNNFRRGLSRQKRIDQRIYTFGDEGVRSQREGHLNSVVG